MENEMSDPKEAIVDTDGITINLNHPPIPQREKPTPISTNRRKELYKIAEKVADLLPENEREYRIVLSFVRNLIDDGM